MKNVLKVLILLVVLAGCKSADWAPVTYNSVRWSNAEIRLHAYFTHKPENSLKAARYYAWFDKGRIGLSQGGYSGKLLHGQYTVWYASGQLKERGFYDGGLKVGQWMLWQEDGSLKEKQKWNRGTQVLPKKRQRLMERIRKIWPLKLRKP